MQYDCEYLFTNQFLAIIGHLIHETKPQLKGIVSDSNNFIYDMNMNIDMH